MIVGSKVDYDTHNLYIPKDGKEDNDYQKSFIATLTIIIRDKDGKVIKKYKQKSHSPTTNFIGIMLPATYYATTGKSWTFTTTSNNTFSYNMSIASPYLGITYPNNNLNHNDSIIGIIIGSGSESNPYSAYNLASPISNGSGVGQLIYSVQNVPNGIAINGNQSYFVISQAYVNQSGGTITITEVGIIINFYANIVNQPTGPNGQLLVWYDVLSSSISVYNGQSVVIYYTFSVS